MRVHLCFESVNVRMYMCNMYVCVVGVCMCMCVYVCACVCVNELKFILGTCERLVYCYVYLDCDVFIVVNSLPHISNGFKGGIREDSDIGANIRYC